MQWDKKQYCYAAKHRSRQTVVGVLIISFCFADVIHVSKRKQIIEMVGLKL